ncbi:MAG: hypothetical protein ACREIP_04625, partial [Alphaproteobacteria bacterium]
MSMLNRSDYRQRFALLLSGTVLVSGAEAISPDPAFAANECGSGPTVSCASSANPYRNGIIYAGSSIGVTLLGGVMVDTTTGSPPQGTYSVGIGARLPSAQSSTGLKTVTVDPGVSITAAQNGVFGIIIHNTAGSASGRVINHGDIATAGINASSIFVQVVNSSSVVNTGTLVTQGAGSNGILAQSYNNGPGNVFVDNSGTIRTSGAGSYGIIGASGTGTVNLSQSGTVDASGIGINLSGGGNNEGIVENLGSVNGTTGVRFGGINARLANNGDIAGTGIGVQALGPQADITNAAGATISGGQNGIAGSGANVLIDLTNAGTVSGASSSGVQGGVAAGATLSIANQGSGIITGSSGILMTPGSLNIVNSGAIRGTSGRGISYSGNGSGTVSIENDGSVIGTSDGIRVDNADTE